MAIFRIELPIVPSLNNAYFNAKPKASRAPGKKFPGRIPTRQTKDWKTEAGWLVRQANPPRIRGPYKLRVLVNPKMRGDTSNRVKLAEDLLVSLQVTPDDSKAVSTGCDRDPSVPPGRCILCVESV